jgi:hypothetical protein
MRIAYYNSIVIKRGDVMIEKSEKYKEASDV